MKTEYRAPTQQELELLAKTLSEEFAGVEVLREQTKGLLVRTIDDDGSLELKVDSSAKSAEVLHRTPATGYYTHQPDKSSDSLLGDSEIILHVVNGYLNELEILCHLDENARMPSPERIEDYNSACRVS